MSLLLPIIAATSPTGSLQDHVWVKNVVAIGSVLSAALLLITALIKLHGLLKNKSGRYREWRERRNAEAAARKQMPSKLLEVSDKVEALTAQMKEIVDSHRGTDGESLAEQVAFLKEQEENKFWLQKRPAFRCDDEGRINKVSQAFCQLVHTVTEQDLYRLGWHRIAADSEELRVWLSSWKGYVKPPRSPFSGELDVVDFHLEARGRWIIRLIPIGHYRGVHAWEGSILPVDDAAKDIAERLGWDMR